MKLSAISYQLLARKHELAAANYTVSPFSPFFSCPGSAWACKVKPLSPFHVQAEPGREAEKTDDGDEKLIPNPQSPIPIRLIVNPTSGKGRGARVAEQASHWLRGHGLENEVRFSRSPADPTELACAAVRDGCRLVVGVGGDGLISQVANELVGTDVTFGLIPAGVGNDFARGLHLPLDVEGACRVLLHGEVRKIDVGQVNDRYFFSVAVLGFGAEVNRRANRFRRFRINALYTLVTVATIFSYDPLPFSVTYDGRERRCLSWMIAVGNTWSSARGMALVPAARPDDGVLDACIINGMGKWELLYTFPRVFKGRHIYSTGIDTIRGKEMTIAADGPCEIYADGERIGSLPVTFKAVPEALRVMVPKQ
ncbi:MAG: diacylglycerol kinase family lipid kinase [Deltaproteobacteria bacterium]|nr:diacylglycerol kinase family lipid kinase [Deltaproteobacteria bacterium]